jgi:predicted thioesterase
MSREMAAIEQVACLQYDPAPQLFHYRLARATRGCAGKALAFTETRCVESGDKSRQDTPMAETPPAPADQSEGVGTTSVMRFTVKDTDTVGHALSGMPMVAGTPYLVAIAETTANEMAKAFIPADRITVGTRVVIDHLGPSKVGAVLVVEATLIDRDRKRLTFRIRVTDGDRTVASVEHVRAAVSREKILAAAQ